MGFDQWVEHFKDDAQVKKIANNYKKLKNEYFENERISCMGYKDELPADLNSRMHLEIHHKLYAKLRFELYTACQDKIAANKKACKKDWELSEKDVVELYNNKVLTRKS